ncbi:hypothetical protein [Rubellicoccus peritrichatus]|uniref:Uncharacterized protein n=1 Tax=Rubellicoccus peritrichatus TaxID=3080537 RepID=A0AAQ3QX79_9BACT|nr:hypothetical protein [Puniceicoccus sp. CR14]WOO43398.1 hypothetical protein RZN69_09885 [Puniceicoccus sp. CR14]
MILEIFCHQFSLGMSLIAGSSHQLASEFMVKWGWGGAMAVRILLSVIYAKSVIFLGCLLKKNSWKLCFVDIKE